MTVASNGWPIAILKATTLAKLKVQETSVAASAWPISSAATFVMTENFVELKKPRYRFPVRPSTAERADLSRREISSSRNRQETLVQMSAVLGLNADLIYLYFSCLM